MFTVPARLPGSRTDTELSVNVGRRVQMECNPLSGLPEPQIIWLKDSQPLDPQDLPRDVRILRAGRILRLLSADVTDSGVYACTVENKAGRDQKRYMLSVHGGFYLLVSSSLPILELVLVPYIHMILE